MSWVLLRRELEGHRKGRDPCAIRSMDLLKFFLLMMSFKRAPFPFLYWVAGCSGLFELLVVVNDMFVSKWIYVKLYFNVPRR